MKKTITIDVHHLTRVEGHGDVHVVVDKGEIKEVRFDVVEAPRYFEAMLLDKKLTSAYEITARICGICSISHTLTSLNAIEQIIPATITEQTRLIRSLAMCSELFSSHLLHICFLAVPDFLGVPSVIPLVEQNPELVLKAINLKRNSNIISERTCGRHTHPLTLVIGGLTFVPPKQVLVELREMIANEMLPEMRAMVEVMATVKLPEFHRETEYLCLDNFYREPAGGRSIKSSDGEITPLDQYRKQIKEYVLPTSTAKFARANRSSYMVGALARLNNLFAELHPEAKGVAEKLSFKVPCYNPYANTVAQLIECVHFAHLALGFIDQLLALELKDEGLPKLQIQAGTGIGATEAPRGLLLHEYSCNDQGFITGANCIIPTNQNCGNINEDMKLMLPQILDLEQEAITLRLEMLVRAYDPCISCSTHLVQLEMG